MPQYTETEQQQPMDQSAEAYPKNQDEVNKFTSGLIKSLHSDQTRDKIMAALTDERAPVAARLATVVSMVLTAMLQRVQQQAGRKPHIQLLLKSIKMLIVEASRMAQIAGVRVTPDDQRNAAKMSGDMLESGMMQKGGQPQGGQMQPQQQAPQGPPQPVQPQGLIAGAQNGR
jgi:hypothetical protein